MRKLLTIALLILALPVLADDPAGSGGSLREQYQKFKKDSKKQYEDFRDQANKEYALFIEKAWEQYTLGEPELLPEEEELTPPVCMDDSLETAAFCYPTEVVSIYLAPVPKPQPLPVSPIVPYNWDGQGVVSFDFYGTPCEVRFDDKQKFSLPSLDKADIANAWRVMAQPKYNNTITDCLKIRDEKSLNDWAYLQMLRRLSQTIFGDSNEANLLMAFLYTQSGYKSRIYKTVGTDTPKIGMFYGTEYVIHGKSSLRSGGISYYPLDDYSGSVEYVEFPFPKEQGMSLTIDKTPLLVPSMSPKKYIQSVRYPELEAYVAVDENEIRFFNDYPVWSKPDDIFSKWASYANTPLNPEVKAQLYPQLLAKLDHEDKNNAVEQLLNLVQSAVPYVYDDEAWGYDRAFFSEESLFYPGGDCEDHAILFSRLVRDLLGMEVVLVHYPGHLATAVYMGDDHPGDQIMVDGKSFTVCDPTWVGARAGRRMNFVDRSRIRAIKLD